MFNFGGITHIMQNPAGTFSYVGAVPQALGELREATRSDIMGGRSKNGMTRYIAPRPTIEKALADLKAVDGAKPCDIISCACRKLF